MADTHLSHAQQQRQENESRFGTGSSVDDHALLTAVMLINDDEKEELEEWKEAHVATGEFATIDWPGWESVISRINRFNR